MMQLRSHIDLAMQSKEILLKGILRDGLYMFPHAMLSPASIKSAYMAAAQDSSTSSKFSIRHSRLGHPAAGVLTQIMKLQNISGSLKNVSQFCDAYKLGKIHALPFPRSVTNACKPSDLIHTDIWGPSSVPSVEGYTYYIHFIDDFSRYT
ncbi:hypothetical protein Scep_012172 [Stephania cephalantha]|uniref:GAG-pre-integrase domain-containing protein n=1 Tax=Stephania cephalantha TaxID=152367 RepID=A0AAP0JEL8_9MAGN